MRSLPTLVFLCLALSSCAVPPRSEEISLVDVKAEADAKAAMAQRLEAERLRIQAEREAEIHAEREKARLAAALSNWVFRIQQKVRSKVVVPKGIQGNPEVQFLVVIKLNGEVVSVAIRKSSGNSLLDSAVKKAIQKASPLPLPADPDLMEHQLVIQYRPYPLKK